MKRSITLSKRFWTLLGYNIYNKNILYRESSLDFSFGSFGPPYTRASNSQQVFIYKK